MRSDIGNFLTRRERKALDAIRPSGLNFVKVSAMPKGVGLGTLNLLEAKGLLQRAPARAPSYRISPDGWHCMFGRTFEQLCAFEKESGAAARPLGTWVWPQSQTE
jgi:hypothetical protein